MSATRLLNSKFAIFTSFSCHIGKEIVAVTRQLMSSFSIASIQECLLQAATIKFLAYGQNVNRDFAANTRLPQILWLRISIYLALRSRQN